MSRLANRIIATLRCGASRYCAQIRCGTLITEDAGRMMPARFYGPPVEMRPLAVLTTTLIAVGLLPTLATAFDPERTFHRGAVLLSVEGGGGAENSFEPLNSHIEFWNAGIRLSLIPFGTTGANVLHNALYGALEVGLEPLFQQYTRPSDAQWAGIALVARYHFLGLGRFVPWIEVLGAAGGTGLKVPEIRSSFAFLLDGGVGVSVFLTDRTALYAGYRLQHISNGNMSNPNFGFESHTGVIGVTFFLK
jgi:Lipid A 3-O-deacylase (PagL)